MHTPKLHAVVETFPVTWHSVDRLCHDEAAGASDDVYAAARSSGSPRARDESAIAVPSEYNVAAVAHLAEHARMTWRYSGVSAR